MVHYVRPKYSMYYIILEDTIQEVIVRGKGYVVLTFRFNKEDNRWLGHCEELGTATFGRSIPEVDKKLKEAVLIHLNTLEDVGECERFFKEHNIVFHETRPKKVEISVPPRKNTFFQSYIQYIPQYSYC